MSEQAVSDGLTALRLPGMKEEFEHQQTYPAFSEQPFSDRVLSLVNSEVERRKNNRINRIIKNAKFKYSAAPEDIKFSNARGLPKSDGLELLKCAWVDRGQHILITGPSGTGKTWLSCAFGIAAARQGNTVRYGRISKILEELQFARLENNLLKTRGKLANYDLLILDDFALHALTNQERMDLFELIEERSSSASLIVVGQRPVEDWYDYLQDALIADAFMDRVRSGSRMINLSGDSLR
jgi:DNA replication protein DnaC